MKPTHETALLLCPGAAFFRVRKKRQTSLVKRRFQPSQAGTNRGQHCAQLNAVLGRRLFLFSPAQTQVSANEGRGVIWPWRHSSLSFAAEITSFENEFISVASRCCGGGDGSSSNSFSRLEDHVNKLLIMQRKGALFQQQQPAAGRGEPAARV